MCTGTLDQSAANQNQAKQDAIYQANVAQEGKNFDFRQNAVEGSNQRITDLLTKEHADTADLSNQTFGDLLSNRQAGFDETTGYAKTAHDAEFNAGMGLVTAQKGIRQQQLDVSNAERDRQLAFQGQADTLGSGLVTALGQEPQNRAAAEASRGAFMTANSGAPGVFSNASMDPEVAAEFAKQYGDYTAKATTRGNNMAGVSAYGDAFNKSGRALSDFGSAVAGIGDKAAISRSVLPDELATGNLAKTDAQAAATGQINAADSLATGLTNASQDNRQALATATQQNAAGIGSMLDNYYGGTTGAESNFINETTDNSKTLQDALTTANNYKLQGTKTVNPLSTFLKDAQSAAQTAASVYGAG